MTFFLTGLYEQASDTGVQEIDSSSSRRIRMSLTSLARSWVFPCPRGIDALLSDNAELLQNISFHGLVVRRVARMT